MLVTTAPFFFNWTIVRKDMVSCFLLDNVSELEKFIPKVYAIAGEPLNKKRKGAEVDEIQFSSNSTLFYRWAFLEFMVGSARVVSVERLVTPEIEQWSSMVEEKPVITWLVGYPKTLLGVDDLGNLDWYRRFFFLFYPGYVVEFNNETVPLLFGERSGVGWVSFVSNSFEEFYGMPTRVARVDLGLRFVFEVSLPPKVHSKVALSSFFRIPVDEVSK